MRNSAAASLEMKREDALTAVVVKMQRNGRRYIFVMKYKDQKKILIEVRPLESARVLSRAPSIFPHRRVGGRHAAGPLPSKAWLWLSKAEGARGRGSRGREKLVAPKGREASRSNASQAAATRIRTPYRTPYLTSGMRA